MKGKKSDAQRGIGQEKESKAKRNGTGRVEEGKR